jgi:hypothetical protein
MSAFTSRVGEHRVLIISAVVVVAVFAVAVAHGGGKSNNTPTSTTGSSPAPASLVSEVGSVPTSVFDAIGSGSATTSPISISAPALTSGGKPEVFYEGAEYCPYCATERWAMAAALSRFGTFSKLGETHSSTTDVYANTQTLSFYNSVYTSSYISFVPLEVYTNIPSDSSESGYTTLQTPTSGEEALVTKYDAVPYLPSQEAGSIPFIDFGGRDLIAGASYDPQVLQGLTWDQIATDMHNPSSKVARGVDGAANTLTAAICKLTDNQPATACDQAVQQIESQP